VSSLNVLIVEDESIVAMEIESFLKSLGYRVIDICSNGTDAITVSNAAHIDILLMDICIKGHMDGIETAEKIKADHLRTEVIFLTAHMDDYNVERAIALDPVAYLSKPFHREELRVFMKIAERKAMNRSVTQKPKPHHLVLDAEFCYNVRYKMLYCCNEPLHLTKKEGELLAILVRNKNKITSAEIIELELWPDRLSSPNTLRTLVKRLREKLKHKFIKTIPAQGYKLTAESMAL